MPALLAEALPALSPKDPLYGLIYYVLGGWLIGSSAVLLLEGILICQVIIYYAWNPEDGVSLKSSVGGLFILTVLKTMQAFAITWINSILYMRDPAGTIALHRDWYQLVNIPLGAVIATYVQSYYCYRLWKLSKKWWFIVPLVTVMLLGLVSAIITASVIGKTGRSSDWFAVHVSCSFATDVLITISSTYFLLQARQSAVPHTRKLISNIIKICCKTALPVTAGTLLELICSRLGSKDLKPSTPNAIILVLLEAVPIIYANCMLYILNSRRTLRLADASGRLGNGNRNRNRDTKQPSASSRLSRIRGASGQAWAAPVELATLGSNHVHTQSTETSDNPYGLEFDSNKSRNVQAHTQSATSDNHYGDVFDSKKSRDVMAMDRDTTRDQAKSDT